MSVTVLQGDCRAVLATLASGSVQCCVSSPPYYGLRDYGTAAWDGGDPACDHAKQRSISASTLMNDGRKHIGLLPDHKYASADVPYRDNCGKCGATRIDAQIGLEPTPDEYVAALVDVFREVKRVLRDDGVCFINLGDSYADKQLQMIPARVALALQADGWVLRSDIIWNKPNPMPESVQGSHFSRHHVTIADYERLSGLPYIDERAGEDWAGDMPGMSEIESPRSKAPLSAKCQGYRYGAGTRGAGGGKGAAPSVCSITARAKESDEVRGERKRQGDAAADLEETQGQRGWQTEGCGEAFGYEGSASPDCPNEAGQRDVCQVSQDGREEASRLRETEGGDRQRPTIYSGSVGRTPAQTQASLLLLQAETEADARSCDTAQQGRHARQGKHRASLSELQFKEEQPDRASLLVGCPGCDKCAKHHGYLFHLSAGRPTSAHEHVFLLAKSARYYWDADAVREEREPDSLRRSDLYGDNPSFAKLNPDRNDGGRGGSMGFNGNPAGRNIRNVWTISTSPFPSAHFATFPPELAERCIKAGSRPGDTILDPFGGAGTTGLVADRLGRNATLIELNDAYCTMARSRIINDCPLFGDVA